MNGLTANSDGQIIDLIERLTRAGYRVSFVPVAMGYLDLIVEPITGSLDELSPGGYWRRIVPVGVNLIGNAPLIFHLDALLTAKIALERAANLLATEAHR